MLKLCKGCIVPPMKETMTLDEHKLLSQNLEWMRKRLDGIETWLKGKKVKGGASRTRNKLNRAIWYIEQAEYDLMLEANLEHGYMTGFDIYAGADRSEQGEV